MIKRAIKYICILACMINSCFIMCIPVMAETATYITITPNECYSFEWIDGRNNGRFSADQPVRFVWLKNGANYVGMAVYNNSFNYYSASYASSTAACGVLSNVAQKGYYGSFPDYAFAQLGAYSYVEPFSTIIDVTGMGFPSWFAAALYYTYGEGAIDPIEPVNWGQLRDVNYQTDIAGSGEACLANRDTITWATDYDTFGNELTNECMVDIRAVRGSWSANTKEDLLKLGGDSIVLQNTVAPILATVPVSNGTFSIEWDEVIQELDISKYINILAVLNPDTNTYLKEGWVYEIRLTNEIDDYEGTWQRVYTATSGTAAGSESIINNGDQFNTIIYQELQNIGILNNQPTTIIIINNTEYPVENPQTGVPPEEDPEDPDGKTQLIIDNLWELIKLIQQGFFNVVNAINSAINEIKAIPGKLLEMFESLFTLGEVDQSVTDELQGIQEGYVSDNQSNALNTLNVLEDIQDDLETAADSAQTCIFEWDDVKVRLPGSSSDAVLIPAGTYNFTATFLQMIEGFGMTYSEYQELVSAVIYCLVALFVYHHVTTFLKDE